MINRNKKRMPTTQEAQDLKDRAVAMVEIHLVNGHEQHAIQAVRSYFREKENFIGYSSAHLDPREIPDDEPMATLALDRKYINLLDSRGLIYAGQVRKKSHQDLLAIAEAGGLGFAAVVAIMTAVGTENAIDRKTMEKFRAAQPGNQKLKQQNLEL